MVRCRRFKSGNWSSLTTFRIKLDKDSILFGFNLSFEARHLQNNTSMMSSYSESNVGRRWIKFTKIYRFHPISINKFERLDSQEILKFCEEMSWRSMSSELRLWPETIAFSSSFIGVVVREDQFPLLDHRHLHFFNSTHPNMYM